MRKLQGAGERLKHNEADDAANLAARMGVGKRPEPHAELDERTQRKLNGAAKLTARGHAEKADGSDSGGVEPAGDSSQGDNCARVRPMRTWFRVPGRRGSAALTARVRARFRAPGRSCMRPARSCSSWAATPRSAPGAAPSCCCCRRPRAPCWPRSPRWPC